jgi:glucokinase
MGEQTAAYVIGLDLGGSSVKWVAADRAGHSLDRGNVSFDPDRPRHWADQLAATVSQIRSARPNCAGIGLSAPGLAAKDARSIAFMPGRLAGLEGLVWSDFLKTPFAIPVLNDAHAALLGEAWIGAAQGSSNVIMLTLGTGVGGAAMVDGKLLLGHIGRAGHLGHVSLDPTGPPDVTGTPGSIELAMGNCTIDTRSNGRFATTHDLIAAHKAGDEGATAVWLKSVRDLAVAICGFINVLDPEIVIIGGGVARAGELLFQPLEGYLRPIEWQPGGHQARIVPATLGEHAGSLGAAKRAWDNVTGP